MIWVIIALILLAAFGPILWLIPSKRDRHLSALRDQARREGLVVELRRVAKLNPSAEERVTAGGRIKQPVVECTAYMHSLPRRLAQLPPWRLLRGDGYPQPRPGWVFDPDLMPRVGAGHEAFVASQDSLQNLFEGLRSDVIGVELAPRALILYWLEGRDAERSTVTAMSDLLRSADEGLMALDDRLQAAAQDDDS